MKNAEETIDSYRDSHEYFSKLVQDLKLSIVQENNSFYFREDLKKKNEIKKNIEVIVKNLNEIIF